MYLLRAGKLTVAKDTSGDYVWTDFDLQRARDVMASMVERRSARAMA
jgi:hypothetical protein